MIIRKVRAMTKADKEQTGPESVEQARKLSYWDALVAEGFVPVGKQIVIAEGHPEVPLTRYRPGQRRSE